MQIVGQHAANQAYRRKKQQIPPERKRIALAPPKLQRGEQAEQRRKNLRHIIQIPQIACNGIVVEKAIFDRTQEQPQHGHGASKQQPAPITAVQNPARYGKAPAHGQTDVNQVGQQKESGRGQRSAHAIRLAKKTGKNEQTKRKAELRNGFSFCGSPISTSCPYLKEQILCYFQIHLRHLLANFHLEIVLYHTSD